MPINFTTITNVTKIKNINSAKHGYDDHSHHGFPYSMLTFIIPIGLLLLIVLYIQINECIWSYEQNNYRNRSNSGYI